MVKQYPYRLFALESTSSKNPSGSFQSTTNWVLISNCRDEKANGRQIRLEDSSIYISNLVVFLPKNCPLVKFGTKIQVRDLDGIVRAEGTVKEFDSGQLNTRIWV